jgi:hypothetical protein
VFGRTHSSVRTNLIETLCPLLFLDGLANKTSSKSRFLRMFGRTIFVSGRAFQKVHICDFTHACPDRPFFVFGQVTFEDTNELIFSNSSLSHMISLFSLLVYWSFQNQIWIRKCDPRDRIYVFTDWFEVNPKIQVPLDFV